ncbi:MAG: flavodoxin domain-containing protein [Candidatus Methanogranum gryphiswaldense]|nr:MAG: flavodoxin domain-containing protein [Candidatus Methanogranum sp. U3.2.1]
MEMQPTIAVIYASSITGNTKKTGKYIADALKADTFDLKKQTVIDLKGYKQIVFGTGIHAGKPYSPLVKFLEKNKADLTGKKVSLYICCMFDDEKGEKQCATVSTTLGIADAAFFCGKGEKDEAGFEKKVDDFIAKQRA